ncbi:MAG: oligosaccharide flippase family protein [Anaeromyxobacteraceae bacterium]
MLLQIQGYLGLLDFGFSTGSVRSLVIAQEGDARLHDLTRTTISWVYRRISWAIWLVGAVVALVLLYAPLAWDGVSQVEIAGAFAIMAGGSAMLMPMSLAPDVLQAQQRLGTFNRLLLVRAIADGVVSVALVAAGFGLVGLACSQVASASVFYFGSELATRSITDRNRRTAPSADNAVLSELWRVTRLTFMQKLANAATRGSDGILIGMTLGPAAVTVYVITLRAIQSAITLATRVIPMTLPGLTQLWTQGLSVQLMATYERASRLVVLGIVCAGLVAGTVNAEFVVVWVGADRLGSSALNWWSVCATALVGYGAFPTTLLTATGHLRRISLVSLLEASLKIALGLGMLYWLGLPGIAVASALAWLATSGPVMFADIAGVFSTPRLRLAWDSVCAPLFRMALPAWISLFAASHFHATRWWEVAAKAALVAIFLACSSAMFGLTREDRSYLKGALQRA